MHVKISCSISVLTKNSTYTAYSRLYNKSDNMIAVVWRMFHCTLHV